VWGGGGGEGRGTVFEENTRAGGQGSTFGLPFVTGGGPGPSVEENKYWQCQSDEREMGEADALSQVRRVVACTYVARMALQGFTLGPNNDGALDQERKVCLKK